MDNNSGTAKNEDVDNHIAGKEHMIMNLLNIIEKLEIIIFIHVGLLGVGVGKKA